METQTPKEGSVLNPLIEKTKKSFLLIKPHAMYSGAEMEIRTFLERNKFVVTGQMRIYMTEEIVKQAFRQKLMDITEEEIQSFIGTVGILVITTDGETVPALWHMAGNKNPVEAKLGTLRRMYGVDRVHNAVYAPKDETEYIRLLGVFELWHGVYVQALQSHDLEAIEWAERQFATMMGQGTDEAEEEGTEPTEEADAPPLDRQEAPSAPNPESLEVEEDVTEQIREE